MQCCLIFGLFLCVTSLSDVAFGIASLAPSDTCVPLDSSGHPQSGTLAGIRKYCSQAAENCKDKAFLSPMVDQFLKQTEKGCAKSKYGGNILRLWTKFLEQSDLRVIWDDSLKVEFRGQMRVNLPKFAHEAFAGTGIEIQIRETYKAFVKFFSVELLIDWLIGENSNIILEIYLGAIRLGFDGNSEIGNILDLLTQMQSEYNDGRAALRKLVESLFKISGSGTGPDSGSCSFKKSNDCTDNAQYFNYTAAGGCPAGFTYAAGICYKVVVSPPLNYDAARLVTSDPYGSRLAKIRDQAAWQYLTTKAAQVGAIAMWIGLRDLRVGNEDPHDWRWQDGTSQPVPDTTGPLKWWTSTPDYSPEDRLVILPPNYCWSDKYFGLPLTTVLQTPANGGKCPPLFSIFENTCYSFDATSGGTPAILNSKQWKFVADLIKNSPKKNQKFFIGGSRVNGNWPFENFEQWCPGEPDNKKESCAEIAIGAQVGLNDLHCYWEISYAKEWLASSCSEWYHVGQRTNGLYRILPRGAKTDVQVYCDMENDGGGWTVIQSRLGKADFSKSLSEYTNGFPNWLGLEQISQLTSEEEMMLLIELTDTKGRVYSVRYSKFQLKKEGSSFKFCVDQFQTSSPGLKDEFSKQQNVAFSVDQTKGGWWFTPGSTMNLNGKDPSGQPGESTVSLMQWSPDVIVTKSQMKVKSTYFSKCINKSNLA